MTDLITRARKEWCEPAGQHPVFGDAFNHCPPEVVAALLDVLKEENYNFYCSHCGDTTSSHRPNCAIAIAEAAITRALEEKP